MNTKSVVAIMGATATGKTQLAIRLAEIFGAEIVSMDSRQVYRGLDIGTAKPTPDERSRAAHHLIDILDPTETNSAGRHTRLVEDAITDIEGRANIPFLVGGTGLYFRAFFYGLIDIDIPAGVLKAIRDAMAASSTEALYAELQRCDPQRAESLSPNDRVRITRSLEVFRSTGTAYTQHLEAQTAGRDDERRDLRIVLTLPRAALRVRIAARTEEMFRGGWVKEVRRLMATGLTPETPAMNSLGYRSIAGAIHAGLDPSSVADEVTTLTQQYAKRQETFFRGIPGSCWVDMGRPDAFDEAKDLVEAWARP